MEADLLAKAGMGRPGIRQVLKKLGGEGAQDWQ
jgi:hypothetical protein